MDGTPQEITNLVGREVYSNNGVFVGEVRDVHLDFERQTVTELALKDLNNELFHGTIKPGKGVMVPYRWVRAVGDVILINDIVERYKEQEEEDAAVA